MDDLDRRIAADNATVALEMLEDRMAEVRGVLAHYALGGLDLTPMQRAALEGCLHELGDSYDAMWLLIQGIAR